MWESRACCSLPSALPTEGMPGVLQANPMHLGRQSPDLLLPLCSLLPALQQLKAGAIATEQRSSLFSLPALWISLFSWPCPKPFLPLNLGSVSVRPVE